MAKKLIVISFLAISPFSCKKDDDIKKPTSCGQNPNAQTLSHGDEIREYIVYVSNSYDETSAVPLMFNFHGYGGNASEYMNYADMRSLADSENFILVYPQGTCLEDNPHWNAGLDSPDNKSDANDFGFIEALIIDLSSNYSIDSKRIYVSGYSNGAMFAYALACYKSNLIAAVGSVSGTMLEETNNNCSPSHPTAMINIHGTSDNILPYAGGEGFSSIEAVLNYWISFNNTNTTPVESSANDSGTTIEHYTYTDGDNTSSVEHYKVIGGDHVWFNINYQGANTSQLIWEFVSKYDINGLR